MANAVLYGNAPLILTVVLEPLGPRVPATRQPRSAVATLTTPGLAKPQNSAKSLVAPRTSKMDITNSCHMDFISSRPVKPRRSNDERKLSTSCRVLKLVLIAFTPLLDYHRVNML